MARRYGSRRTYNKTNSAKRKYTTAETIAFRLGQEQRVRKTLSSSNTNTRCHDAFVKGLRGPQQASNRNKPLFNE